MADRILFQDGDLLSRDALAAVLGVNTNAVDFVSRGLGFTPDYANDRLDIAAGAAVLTDGGDAYVVEPDARASLVLPAASGTNHVFLEIDVASDTISYHIDSDDTAPADPSLKVGTVDTASNSATELNRKPDGEWESVTTERESNDSAAAVINTPF